MSAPTPRITPGKRSRRRDATTGWVERLNRLGREIDEAAASMHPSARTDALADDMARWRDLATREEAIRQPLDRARIERTQLSLFETA